MSRTQADFRSARCSSYLSTMTKHFSQKIEVAEVDDAVHLRFSCGLAVLSLIEDSMNLRVEAPTKAQMLETCQVVESHLLRFAFREEPEPLIWRDL